MSPLPYYLATLVGAFLLFLVQPLIAKQILPWFGGAPSVWTTCMLFFQVGLVAGYAYAHASPRLGRRRQAWFHLGVLVIAAISLPIIASPGWKPADAGQPVLRVLGLLTATVAVPYVVLAATAPLVQDWFRVTQPGQQPYRLYALSNIGSVLALAVYPLIVERWLAIDMQAWAWSAAFVGFAGICGVCAWQVRQAQDVSANDAPRRPDAPSPASLDSLLWVLLPACGSALLLAVTNQLCQDVAVVPLLWTVPLALYLLTFILCFAEWYRRVIWLPVFAAALGGTGYALAFPTSMSVPAQASALLLLLTSGCMVCHGELVAVRPDARFLTRFYLAMSIGGALGGLFVALVAPLLFVNYAELPFLAMLVPILLLAAYLRHHSTGRGVAVPAWLVLMPVLVFSATGVVVLGENGAQSRSLDARRNFYGTLRVADREVADGRTIRQLFHGRVLHGAQFLDDGWREVPTTYFGEGSGAAVALDASRSVSSMSLRVGVIGLGVGTLAAWGRTGDRYTFFEINPDVVDVARSHFTFLEDSAAAVDVIIADGRLGLERELAADGRAGYDVLIVDAFSGDSIPVHLLTRECFELYWSALATDGVLAINISNHFLDLEPVVRGVAEDLGLRAAKLVGQADPEHATRDSEWMVVSRTAEIMSSVRATPQWREPGDARIVWTDRYSSLVSVFR